MTSKYTRDSLSQREKSFGWKFYALMLFSISAIFLVLLFLTLLPADDKCESDILNENNLHNEDEKIAQAVMRKDTPASCAASTNFVEDSCNPRISADTPEVTTNNAGVISYKNGPKFVIPPPKTKTIFHNVVDSTVAAALAIDPGEMVYLTIPDNFDELFSNMLESETVFVEEADDESTIRLKVDVVDVKRKLREILKRGESPKAALDAELRELSRLAETYNYVKAGLEDLRKEGASEQERKDYVDAANQVMENYNIRKKIHLELDEKLNLVKRRVK